MNKSIILLTVFLISTTISFSQHKIAPHNGPIDWMSFEEAVEKTKKEPRKLFIDVYTQWCGWCKKMDASTFKDSVVAKYMNEKYYAVKFDAETKDSIPFFDKVFTFKAENKANELAISLLNGQMSYPSFVFLDEKFNMLSPLPGFQQPDQLMRVLKYFGDNIYATKKWDDYARDAAEGK